MFSFSFFFWRLGKRSRLSGSFFFFLLSSPRWRRRERGKSLGRTSPAILMDSVVSWYIDEEKPLIYSSLLRSRRAPSCSFFVPPNPNAWCLRCRFFGWTRLLLIRRIWWRQQRVEGPTRFSTTLPKSPPSNAETKRQMRTLLSSLSTPSVRLLFSRGRPPLLLCSPDVICLSVCDRDFMMRLCHIRTYYGLFTYRMWGAYVL